MDGFNNSNRLKIMRNKAGLLQRELSEKSGVSLTMIQKYEQGEKNIDNARLETLVNLAMALGCGVQSLLNSDELAGKFVFCQYLRG